MKKILTDLLWKIRGSFKQKREWLTAVHSIAMEWCRHLKITYKLLHGTCDVTGKVKR
jgi:hypothetical protein